MAGLGWLTAYSNNTHRTALLASTCLALRLFLYAPCIVAVLITMSKGSKYLLVSLPTSISPSNHVDEALTALRSTVGTDNGTTSQFAIPNFKIGTLDALVQQADELAKLESACESVVGKVGDSLKNLMDGDDERTQQHKTINDSAYSSTYSSTNTHVHPYKIYMHTPPPFYP